MLRSEIIGAFLYSSSGIGEQPVTGISSVQGVQNTFRAVELIPASKPSHNATGDVIIPHASAVNADIIHNFHLGLHIF